MAEAGTRIQPRLRSTTTRRSASAEEEFGYKNEMEGAALEKIVLNMGVGEAVATQEARRCAAAT
jgi:ribosomal protein L5